MAYKPIVLGSGKLYIATWDGSTIPVDATIETEGNLLGLITAGASINYNPSYYTATDDLGLVSKKFITNEEITLKSGLMTWNGTTLKKLVSTGTLTETSTLRTLKIGGASNFQDTNYIIRFVHEDAVSGDLRATIVGSNSTGLSLSFQKDKETVVDCEFKAVPLDSTGTLIIIAEEIPA